VIKKEAKRILRYEDLIRETESMCNVKAKLITSNKRGDGNHFKISQTIPEQRTEKSLN
jgi:hypothetical protein